MAAAQFTLHEASTREEMDAIVDLTWIAHAEPYRPFLGIFFPIFGPTKADRDAAVAESKERLWKAHGGNPGSHWFYVKDTATGIVVGSTEWIVYEKNPFKPRRPKIDAAWWPAGTVGREFASRMLEQAYTPRFGWMRRPHIALNLMSVHPNYRRHGIGSLLMKWGDDKAKELHLECFLEASESGRYLYEKHGYLTLLQTNISPSAKNPSPEWKKLAHEFIPQLIYPMWKPANGVVTDDTPLPWELGQVDDMEGLKELWSRIEG